MKSAHSRESRGGRPGGESARARLPAHDRQDAHRHPGEQDERHDAALNRHPADARGRRAAGSEAGPRRYIELTQIGDGGFTGRPFWHPARDGCRVEGRANRPVPSNDDVSESHLEVLPCRDSSPPLCCVRTRSRARGRRALSAQTIYVTTINDVVDFPCRRKLGICRGPMERWSMREALIAANNTPGPQTIGFHVPAGYGGAVGSLVRDPQRGCAFPVNGDDTTVDGTTQTLFTGDLNLERRRSLVPAARPTMWNLIVTGIFEIKA